MFRSMTAILLWSATASVAFSDPLPSWNDTDTKSKIIAFVESVTDPASQSFVPEKERIAVFDNDGTLWSEQPLYFQGLYALDKLREKAKADPSILTSDTLKAAAKGDIAAVMKGGEAGLVEILNVSHANISVDDFKASAREWLTTAKHPTSGLTYAGMTYQPMVELLSYLRDENFHTYIVSGGGIDFMRSISDDAYGIPPWQVVGSEGKTQYVDKDGNIALMKMGDIAFIDDGPGKPVGISNSIGARPIFAAGNSDGDFQMLEYTTNQKMPHFGLLIHHTDGKREFAYDRDSHVGRLDKALDAAPKEGWVVMDMAKDWAKIWTGNQ